MKKRILKKIANKLSQFGMSQTPEEAYRELLKLSGINFSDLCAIYNLTNEECNYVAYDDTELFPCLVDSDGKIYPL